MLTNGRTPERRSSQEIVLRMYLMIYSLIFCRQTNVFITTIITICYRYYVFPHVFGISAILYIVIVYIIFSNHRLCSISKNLKILSLVSSMQTVNFTNNCLTPLCDQTDLWEVGFDSTKINSLLITFKEIFWLIKVRIKFS